MLEIIKFLSIISAAIFGVYGSIVNFKDKNNQVTTQGKIGVLGIIFSAIIGGGIQIYTDIQAEKSSLNLIKKNTEILTEINRSLHPLDGLKVEYLIEPDWTIDYFKVIHEKVKSEFDHPTSFGNTIYKNNWINFDILRDTLCKVGVDLYFFKDKINVNDFSYQNALVAGTLGEDLRITINNPCNFKHMMPDSSDFIQLDYDLIDKKLNRLSFEVSSKETKSNTINWRGNGKIVSLSDLQSSQLIIQLKSSGMRVDSCVSRKKMLELRSSVILRNLNIRLENGIVMSFDNDNLVKYKNNYNHFLYSYNFPEEKSRILDETHYDDFKLLRLFREN